MENLKPDNRTQLRVLDNKKKIHPRNLSLKSKLPVQNQGNQSASCKLDDYAAESKVIKGFSNAKNFASTSNHGMSDDLKSSPEDDSLKDFRSPVKEIDMNESLVDFQVSVPSKRLARKDSKPIVKKKRHNRDIVNDVKQPSIESSFFRPKAEVQTAFTCFLCFKSYKDATARMNHMKGCAVRNNISTKQLLEAVELQEKQANERKAMGLLVAPPIQPKKTVSRKMISDKDPQLQLALALSMSLHEAQISEEIEEAHLLVGEPYSPMDVEMSEERRKTLQNFGFTTNKPTVASTSNKSRKKRPAGPTVLQTRTQEERDRITTVRIAEVLMGDEPITQALLKKEEKVIEPVKNIDLKSRLLRSYHCVEDRLWDKTQQTLNGQSSYPCNLLESSPCKKKSESKTERTEEKSSREKTLDEASNHPSSIPDEINVFARLNSKSSSESSTDDDAVSVKYKVNQDSVMDLSRDWRCMLGANYMSDVLVVVKENRTIYAHRVVFWARCCSLMNDVTKNTSNTVSELEHRVLWPETELDSAYAFLEFVYCGDIERHVSIFNYPDMLAEVRALARKYQLKKLFVYLRNKSNELKSKAAQIPDQRSSKTRINSESRLADTYDDSSGSFNGATSICSKETDINSLSTECNDPVMDKRGKEKHISDRDTVCSGDLRFTKEQEKKDMLSSSSLKVNFSTSSNTLSDEQMSQGAPASIAATLNDIADDKRLLKSVSISSKKNSLATQDNNYLEVINDETLERERSVSPDIFDDSESENATCSYAVFKERYHGLDYEINGSDAQIEFACSSKEKVQTRGQLLDEKTIFLDQEISVADIEADISNKNDRQSLEKPNADLPFVTTRTRRNFENTRSTDSVDFHSDIESLNREKSLSGTFSKQKGDITLAIEKIQKLNSKTVSESDSESESVEPFRIKKRRNPFRLHLTETSSILEESIENNVKSELDDNGPQRRRNKLSIFEKKIEIAAQKNPTMFNLPTHMPGVGSGKMEPSESFKSIASTSGLQDMKLQKQNDTLDDESIIEPSQKLAPRLDDCNETIFDLTQESSRESKSDSDKETNNTTVDDKDLSMFEKYKRKHRHNSIDKYRAALRNASLAISVSSSKDTGGALSSDHSQISDSELSDRTDEINSITFSSKYEYTEPNQSKSNFQKELLSMSSKSKEHINISRKILSSAESEDREKSTVKLGDVEFSDLDISPSDFSSLRYSDKLSKSRANGRSQGESISDKKSADEFLDDKKMCNDTPEQIVDVPSFSTNVKLECTKITVPQRNLSDEETDTECLSWIESVVPKNKKRFTADEDKLTDIYDEDTDTEEIGDKGSQARISCSKIEVNKRVNDVSKEIPNSQPLVGNRLESSSPECEITGIFQSTSTSINFDFVKNVSDEIGLLLEECKAPSQTLHNSSMSQVRNNSGPSISDSFGSTPAHRVHRNDYSNFTPHNIMSDYDDDNFLANQNFSEAHCSNGNSQKVKQADVEKTGESSKAFAKKKYDFSESDFSDYEEFKIRKTNVRTSISSGNRSKTMKKSIRSTPLRCGSVSPENNPSPLRTFKVKSISENILKSKPTSKTNSMNDSVDGKFTSRRTPSVDRNISKRNDKTTPQREISSENITPLADYSAMKTPELRKELDKYGFKPQKRHRAKQLLRYIYNELHPLVPVADSNVPSYSNISSSDDEMPAPKRLNKSKSFEELNDKRFEDNAESDDETLASNIRTESGASDDNELANYDLYSLSQSDDSKSLENVFRQLIEVDKDLHNKVLTYEPLNLEELHSTLKSQGFKCKLNALMNFLDEQCITFRQMANAKKSRTRRKVSPKKNQSTR